ncbi:hypothetical protein D3C81_1782170 [compost metagenome]
MHSCLCRKSLALLTNLLDQLGVLCLKCCNTPPGLAYRYPGLQPSRCVFGQRNTSLIEAITLFDQQCTLIKILLSSDIQLLKLGCIVHHLLRKR